MSVPDRENRADTVFALSSAEGRAGIAVIRVSGSDAGAALRALAGEPPAPRRASLRHLRAGPAEDALDRAMVVWFPGPASFTGEDVAELHVHGGQAVIAGVLDALSALPGLRLAFPGEFARRAFDNGKIDLTEAEGLADLINAETEAQRAQALRQADGGLRAIYEDWRERLVRALALMEAGLDFIDEADVPKAVAAQARPIVNELIGEIGAHLADGGRGERLRDGLDVVIAGPPNAGKSSLLNAVSRRDVAIVTAEAGTTRDVIETRLDLAGYPVTLSDTAGLRTGGDPIEQEGMRRARERAGRADVVLWLMDAGETEPAPVDAELQQGHNVIPVLSKCDLLVGPAAHEHIREAGAALVVSAVSGAGLEVLIERLGQEARGLMGVREAPVVTRARHRLCLGEALDALTRFGTSDESYPELSAEDLRQAAVALGRLTGRVDVEDVLDRVFAEFCIGK